MAGKNFFAPRKDVRRKIGLCLQVETPGCLAAGRGFFHINAHGGAEPCPFSPFSDVSLCDHTLLEALQSPFFHKVRDLNAQEEGHMGGCALFAKEDQVKALLFSQKA